MATIVYKNGHAKVSVPAGEEIAVFSNGPVTISKIVGYPNVPSTVDLVTTTTAGEQYVSSGIATVATTVIVEPGASDAFYEVGAAPSVTEPQTDITAADATFTITGLAAAQGGFGRLVGGASSTSANAGGAAEMLGGAPGLTGVGGAVNLTGAAGGATSGAGGAVNSVGGIGTNGNAAGGAIVHTGGVGNGSGAGGAIVNTGGAAGSTGTGGAVANVGGAATAGAGGTSSITGGAGGGTGAGGNSSVVGGASGAGATGNGGDVLLTGGAAASTNGDGGSIILQPGALSGSGINGAVINRSTLRIYNTSAQTTATDTASLTDAQMVAGVLACTPTAAAAYTVRTGTQLKAALPADLAAGDAFDLVITNLGGTGDDITLTADTGITIVGDPVVGPVADVATEQMSTGIFQFRFVSGTTFVATRIG
jgi:hypothetical protein